MSSELGVSVSLWRKNFILNIQSVACAIEEGGILSLYSSLMTRMFVFLGYVNTDCCIIGKVLP
jgi:hypothetical protein